MRWPPTIDPIIAIVTLESEKGPVSPLIATVSVKTAGSEKSSMMGAASTEAPIKNANIVQANRTRCERMAIPQGVGNEQTAVRFHGHHPW